MARPYPRNKPLAESGTRDPLTLVELDTYIAGYVSRVAEGHSLAPTDRAALANLTAELRDALNCLSGSTLEYFASLLSLAEFAAQIEAH